MSIGKRTQEALIKLHENDLEGSLSPLCQIIDATSKKTYPLLEGNGNRMRTYLSNIQGLSISYLLKGAEIIGEIKYELKEKKINLETVLYKWIRCDILHEAELKGKIILTDKPILGCTEDAVLFSRRHAEGLLLAVICSSANIGERCPTAISYPFFGCNTPIDALWGNEPLVRALISKHFLPRLFR